MTCKSDIPFQVLQLNRDSRRFLVPKSSDPSQGWNRTGAGMFIESRAQRQQINTLEPLDPCSGFGDLTEYWQSEFKLLLHVPNQFRFLFSSYHSPGKLKEEKQNLRSGGRRGRYQPLNQACRDRTRSRLERTVDGSNRRLDKNYKIIGLISFLRIDQILDPAREGARSLAQTLRTVAFNLPLHVHPYPTYDYR